MSTPVLQLSAVTVRRSGTAILDSVDLTVAEGQRWVVLGPNGAGKSTLIALAAGRLFPTEGTVEILGETVGKVDLQELRPLIGLSSAALADRIPDGETVLDAVRTAAYGITGRWREEYEDMDDAQARRLLADMGVAHLAERTYGTLSSGERKRVQVARALMTDPEMLLLDEPAAGLDLGGRERLVAALGELASDEDAPVTMLVTHHVEEIPQGFTHAILLAHGSAVASGRIEDVLTEENLEAAYELPLTVTRENGRWRAAGHVTAG